jgi:hypothetical protein
MAAAVLAMALVSPAVNAQGKGGDRGGSGPSATPGGGKGGGGGGGSTSGADRGGRSMSPGDRSGKTFWGGDRGRSFTEQSGPKSGKQHSERRGGDRRRHSRRGGGVDFGYYGYGYVSSECDWLYRRAVNSGSAYWWRRYRACTSD